ncbi:MAG: hypothetical protein PF439_08650 [Helicobacteraceae bacterium]|jgi:hypothetical protein|nr:hypothetical protein [Helicobacteraceae bacterium]
MSRTNTSSVEMDDGIKIAFKARTKKNTFGTTTDINDKKESGERKTTSSDEKAKAKKKAKMAKQSKRKNK